MKFIPFLILFMACNPLMWKAAEDAVVGEVKVVEQVVDDLSGMPTQPASVQIPIKKF